MHDVDTLYKAIRAWAENQGIAVSEKSLRPDLAGHFNGTSITMNPSFSVEERAYYLVHALGSIALWSKDKEQVQQIFDELRDAKETDSAATDKLQLAIEKYRAFEIRSSELAVWLLQSLGAKDAIDRYTNFMRADLESMTQFHRTGKAPKWQDFFSAWNRQVETGQRHPAPFHSRPIPPFAPQLIERQEIKQQQ